MAATSSGIMGLNQISPLDTATSRQIFSLFQMIGKKEGITVLLSTHGPLIDEYADRIYMLRDSCIQATK